MTAELELELEGAIRSSTPLEEIVAKLRHCRDEGVSRGEVYSFLEALRRRAQDEETDDRILEVADFVAGQCSPHMKIWDN